MAMSRPIIFPVPDLETIGDRLRHGIDAYYDPFSSVFLYAFSMRRAAEMNNSQCRRRHDRFAVAFAKSDPDSCGVPCRDSIKGQSRQQTKNGVLGSVDDLGIGVQLGSRGARKRDDAAPGPAESSLPVKPGKIDSWHTNGFDLAGVEVYSSPSASITSTPFATSTSSALESAGTVNVCVSMPREERTIDLMLFAVKADRLTDGKNMPLVERRDKWRSPMTGCTKRKRRCARPMGRESVCNLP